MFQRLARGAKTGAVDAEARVDAALQRQQRLHAVLRVAQQGVAELACVLLPRQFHLRQRDALLRPYFAPALVGLRRAGRRTLARRIEVLQRKTAVRAIGQRDLAHQLRRAREQPEQVADALLRVAILDRRIQPVPVAFAQPGQQRIAVAQAPEMARLGVRFGQPDGDPQILAVRGNQLFAAGSDKRPVGFLQGHHPLALVQAGIVVLARARDRVELLAESDIVAAGPDGADRLQQLVEIEHGMLPQVIV